MVVSERNANHNDVSRMSQKLRRTLMIMVLASTPLLGVVALGANSASATTSEVTTNYHGTCVGGYYGGAGSVYCLSSRLTSTGVAEFKSTVIVDTNSNDCFAGGGNDTTVGFYCGDPC